MDPVGVVFQAIENVQHLYQDETIVIDVSDDDDEVTEVCPSPMKVPPNKPATSSWKEPIGRTECNPNPSCQSWFVRNGIELVRDSSSGLFQLSRRPRLDGYVGARYIQFHDFAQEKEFLLTLDSSPDGILHVIKGMTSQEVLNEVGYKFKTKGKSESMVPFLNNMVMLKRKYSCAGIRYCKRASVEMKNFRHSNIDDVTEWHRRERSPKNLPPSCDMMTERAISLYRTIESMESNGYCKFVGKVTVGADPILGGRRCTGRPVMRRNSSNNLRFSGCSGISWDFNTAADGWRATEKRHMSISLKDLTMEGIDALEKMMKTGIVPNLDKSCDYISPKTRRGAIRCMRCFSSLLDSGNCPFEMYTFENMDDNRPVGLPTNDELLQGLSSEGDEVGKKVLFAVTFGEHNHAPPPIPPVTVGKRRLLADETQRSPDAKPVVVKIRAQNRLLEGGVEDGSRSSIGRKAVYLMGRSAREGKNPIYEQVNSLFRMVSDPTEGYIRECRTIEDGFVVLLAHDSMLRHAATASFFSGDATYKSVTEDRRDPLDKDWYLYNIVTGENNYRCEASGNKTVVVARFLISRLTVEGYRAGWSMFLEHVRIVYSQFFESEPLSRNERLRRCRIKVPYIPMGSEFDATFVEIRAITTDFESVEVQGIGLALEDATGAPKDLHIESVMVGCDVHFDRDVKTRTNKVGTLNAENLRDAIKNLHKASEIEEADKWMEVVRRIDPCWAEWVQKHGIRNMIAPAYSTMNSSTRALCFHDTNGVESQNRVVNRVCGVGMIPGVAVRELKQLDSVRIAELVTDSWIPRRTIPSRNFGGSCKKKLSAVKRKSKTVPSTQRNPKRRSTGLFIAQKKTLLDISKVLGDALMKNGCDNPRRKVLASICLDIENTLASKCVELEDLRRKILRAMLEHGNDNVLGAELSNVYGKLCDKDDLENNNGSIDVDKNLDGKIELVPIEEQPETAVISLD